MNDEILFRKFYPSSHEPSSGACQYLRMNIGDYRGLYVSATGEILGFMSIAPPGREFFGPDIEEKRRQEILSRKFSLDDDGNWRHRYDLFCRECGAEEVYMIPFGKFGGKWCADGEGNEHFFEPDRIPICLWAEDFFVEATFLWCERCGHVWMQEYARGRHDR